MNTQNLLKVPGYQYNEYLLVIYPNNHISDKILEVKKAFAAEYKTGNINLSRPALTLVNFIQFDLVEERLINRLTTLAAEIKPLHIELKGFGSFPSHTIYINVNSKLTLQNLARELNGARKLMTLNKEFKPHFIRETHFIIAQKLLPWQYEKGWLQLSQVHFTGRFIAGEMALLKKPLTKYGNPPEAKHYFNLVKQFEFRNLPATSGQGNLFS